MVLRAIDPKNSRWLRVNQKFCDMLGYTHEELLQLTSVDISLPDERHLSVDYNERLLRGDLHSCSREKRYLRKDGTTIWTQIWLSAAFDPDGNPTQIISVIRDISKQKQIEQRLKQSEERFRDFAGSAADWFWEMDQDLRFTYFSPNVERVVGAPPEWHYGKSRENLLGDDYDQETWAEHLEDLAARRPFRDFTYYREGEGVEPKWLRASGIPVFDADGGFAGYRGTGSDITASAVTQTKDSRAR